jgi:putative glutamine amidotransferase
MRRPVIGIPSLIVHARYGAWDEAVHLLPRMYVDAIQRAGGAALIIPADATWATDPDAVLDRIDGLLLAGGADVDPQFYGADQHPETNGTTPERDTFEIALARRAVERDMPFLGICRGMQVMNVALGGTLHQHLPEVVGHGEHRRVAGSFAENDHDVHLEAGSLAARSAGEPSAPREAVKGGRTKPDEVNGAGRTPAAWITHVTKSHHHQGIDELGEGLVVTGRSDLDDLPEAIELPDARFVLGVQWHPEADEQSRLIAALVEEAS